MYAKGCLKDGYIYNSSIAQNIAMSEQNIDTHKVFHALKIAGTGRDIIVHAHVRAAL